MKQLELITKNTTIIDGLITLELWQSTFDGTYYDVTQIDAIIDEEILNPFFF